MRTVLLSNVNMDPLKAFFPDDWEIATFGSTPGQDGHSDTDGDGTNERAEYLLRTDPLDAREGLVLECEPDGSGGHRLGRTHNADPGPVGLVRRHHLAGSLGKAVLELCDQKRWARRVEGSCIVRFSVAGERGFREAFLV